MMNDDAGHQNGCCGVEILLEEDLLTPRRYFSIILLLYFTLDKKGS